MNKKSPINELICLLRDKGLEYFGRYYGVYNGFVEDVEDPEHLNRVKVYVPEVYGPIKKSYWAFPKSLYSGANYGVQLLPEKGDLVTISFKMGNYKFPLWSYGRYIKEQKPEDFEPYNVKGLVTPSGIKILLDGSDVNIINTEGYRVKVTAEKILLGKEGGELEPAALGDTTISLLKEMIGLIESLVIATPSGNSTLPHVAPTTVQWDTFKDKLDTLLSKSINID